jgi:signal transduction histidine kinase
MMVFSLRLRLLGLSVISIIVTLAVAGASLTFLFERHLLRHVARDLEIRWTELASVVGSYEGKIPTITQMLADPRYEQPYSGAYWQVSDDSQPLLRSRSLWDDVIGTRVVAPTATEDKAFEAAGPNGSRLYVIEREVTLDGAVEPHTFRLAVALDQADVLKMRQSFGWDVARVLSLIALALTSAAWLQLTLGLRPLRALGRELKEVREGRLARLMSRFPDEIAPLAENLNRLLDRQEQLVRKARDRAGSLAHGLKTPLTILSAEVRKLEAEGQREVAQRLNEQLTSIRRHVDRELARSRTSGAAVAMGAYTAVEDSVRKLLHLMQFMPRGDVIIWWNTIPADLKVCMEPDDFGEVVGNLLDNARKWAKTIVAVRADISGGRARFVVEDDGPGFSGNHTSLTSEHATSSRASDMSSGLGLAIVRDILAEYQSSLFIANSDGRCCVSFEIDICGSGIAAQAKRENQHEDGRELSTKVTFDS